jgi:hypothetical protein
MLIVVTERSWAVQPRPNPKRYRSILITPIHASFGLVVRRATAFLERGGEGAKKRFHSLIPLFVSLSALFVPRAYVAGTLTHTSGSHVIYGQKPPSG